MAAADYRARDQSSRRVGAGALVHLPLAGGALPLRPQERLSHRAAPPGTRRTAGVLSGRIRGRSVLAVAAALQRAGDPGSPRHNAVGPRRMGRPVARAASDPAAAAGADAASTRARDCRPGRLSEPPGRWRAGGEDFVART